MTNTLQRRDLLAWGGLTALGSATAAQADEPPSPKPPERVALDASLGQMLDGKAVNLADFAGKPVVVFFWASWCPHCRRELPEMERLQLAAKDRARVVAVNCEERAVFRKLNRQLSEASKMLHTYDPEERSGKAFSKPPSVPYTLVIRTDGTVAATQSGWGDDSLNYIVKHVDEAIVAAQPPRS